MVIGCLGDEAGTQEGAKGEHHDGQGGKSGGVGWGNPNCRCVTLWQKWQSTTETRKALARVLLLNGANENAAECKMRRNAVLLHTHYKYYGRGAGNTTAKKI